MKPVVVILSWNRFINQKEKKNDDKMLKLQKYINK